MDIVSIILLVIIVIPTMCLAYMLLNLSTVKDTRVEYVVRTEERPDPRVERMDGLLEDYYRLRYSPMDRTDVTVTETPSGPTEETEEEKKERKIMTTEVE